MNIPLRKIRTLADDAETIKVQATDAFSDLRTTAHVGMLAFGLIALVALIALARSVR